MKEQRAKTFLHRTITVVLSLMMTVGVLPAWSTPASAASFDLVNPITGTVQGAGYDESAGHYGIDLYPYSYGDPVYAVASGTMMYSCERNHTKAIQSGDDCGSVKIILDEPITYNGHTYVCAYYTHMSELVYDVYCGYNDYCVTEHEAGLREGALPTESVRVEAGDIIGYVGKGNGATHLHFSFEMGEADGYDMMPNSEYYDVFGWSYNGSITAGESVGGVNDSLTAYASTLSQLKAKFPDGKYWNGGDVDKVTSSPCSSHSNCDYYGGCSCNSFSNAIQCHGFALKLGYDAFGSNPRNWSRASSPSSYVDSLKPGDIVTSDSPYHTFFVIGVTSTYVSIGECNYGGKCLIKWGRTISKSTIKGYGNLQIYIAPSTLPIDETCDCSTSYAGTYTCTTNPGYSLSIRSGHGTSYSVIGSIPSGASVTVTKANGTWAHVTYNGVSGYASMDYFAKPYTPTSKYPVPFKAYPISSADHAANAYDSINGNHIGYIYGSDYCTVKQVYDNGWCLVTCPWNGSTKDVYTYYTAFLAADIEPYMIKVEATKDSYIRLDSSTKLGSVNAGDHVVMVNHNYQARAQIIHPHSDGTYRCAWVDYSAFVHTHNPGSAATCTSPQVCTTCDAVLANALGHKPGSAATCTNAQICTRSGCGTVIKAALGHTPGAAATCTSAQTCTRCGTTIKSALGHTPGAAATCTSAQTCTRCGTTIKSALGHNPGAAATCTSAQTCTRCGTTITAALGHNPGANATCTADQICTVCNTVLESAGGHVPGSEATCTVPQICTVCETVLTDSLGHTPGAAATCEDAQICTVCSEVLTEAIGHNYTAGTKTDEEHPHTIYNLCICGAMEDSGETAVMDGCTICYPETETPEPEPPVDADVTFTLGSVTGKPGETVEIPVIIDSAADINSIALRDLTYDASLLTFLGFSDTEEIEEKCFISSFDVENGVIVLALDKTEALTGTLCTLLFQISEEASDCTASVSMTPVVKCDATAVGAALVPAEVTVKTYILGDINGDDSVDINDARALFRYSMLPDIYPVSYPAEMDFDGNGYIDINDARRLFRYSMLPDIYPLF